ncbi:ATP-dependent DNA helicase PIF1 [Trifolium repens]|nr:ATP-dependent DNA helicase PIF1 [Trifolium repens]
MDARGANTFLSHNQLPNLSQGFRDIFLSPHGINKRQWRLHCMKNGSDFPARYRRILAAAIRSKGDIVLTVASSGIASLLLPGGRTAHSKFKILVPTFEIRHVISKVTTIMLNC